MLVLHLIEGMFVLIESLFPFIRCIDPLVPENILRILGNINVILRRISFLNDKSVICNYMEVQIIFNRSHVTHIFLQRVKWILHRHPNNLRPLHCLVFPLPFFDQRLLILESRNRLVLCNENRSRGYLHNLIQKICPRLCSTIPRRSQVPT